MVVSDEEIIGKTFRSNKSNTFKVIALTDKKDNRLKLFEIEFEEVNGVSYRRLARKEDILKGKPTNPFYPSVYGKGYLGNASKKGNETQYNRWSKMISRCYNPANPKYKTYGAVGVTVSDRWLCFENYLEDFSKIEGYAEDMLSTLHLDKDLKVKETKVYNLETCMFVSAGENSKEMNRRVNQVKLVATSPDGDIFESDNQREFAQEHGLDYKGINAVLTNYKGQKAHKGWTFKYKEGLL